MLRTAVFVVFALILALFIVAAITSVHAHSWYPVWCCGGSDCASMPDGSVRWTQGGWLIIKTSEVIAEKDTQTSQDEHFHRCTKYDGSTRCFFAPGAGT